MKKILTMIILMSSLNLLAQTYYLHPLKGKKVEIIHATNQLIHASLQEKNLTLVTKPGNAILEFKGKVIHLGKATIIQLTMLKDGNVVSATKGKVMSIETLDQVVDKMIDKLTSSQNTKVASTKKVKKERVGQIKKENADKLSTRIKSRKFETVAFGGTTFVNGPNTNVGYYLKYGYIWDVDAHMAIKLQADMNISSSEPSAFFGMASLGMNYYFSDTKFSPYIGADFGFGTSKDDNAGFALGASAGVLMFRTATTQIGIEARYQSLTSKNNTGEIPSVFSISLAVYY